MEELLEILEELKPGVDFKNNQHLIDDGVLESLEIISLASEINDEFDVELSVADIMPENFNSVDAIWALIQKLQAEE
ncbi:MAG TPA: acyl carrier protein [Clostridiales bacterium]|nr:acyl carrier protein [Clostridiales bacterium]